MGARLGRYVVLRHLASGGMADVLLGRTEGLDGFERHVVLKRIRSEHANDQRFIRMFLDEARVAANLHHQHIVQVHDVGESAGEYFIAMEYLHGEDVRAILSMASKARQHVPLGYAIAIVAAAAAGLHYAHERRGPDKRSLGIVHRDISPSNILVGYDGSIKVVDFGIAKASARKETRSSSLKGKISYMSPEQCKGAEVDRRSDVYSLGVVLYELCTTTRLFKGESDYLVMDQIVNGRVSLPQVRRPDLPHELSAIIMRAIAPDPERRYATADELRIALDQFAADASLTASTSAIASYLRAQFGDKPEPWVEHSGLLAAFPVGTGDLTRPRPGWTEQSVSAPLPRRSEPIGSSRSSGSSGVPAAAVIGELTPVVTRSPTDSKMGWESHRPPAPRGFGAAKLAMIAVPVTAALGVAIWWFADSGPAGAVAEIVARSAPPPAAASIPDPAPPRVEASRPALASPAARAPVPVPAVDASSTRSTLRLPTSEVPSGPSSRSPASPSRKSATSTAKGGEAPPPPRRGSEPAEAARPPAPARPAPATQLSPTAVPTAAPAVPPSPSLVAPPVPPVPAPPVAAPVPAPPVPAAPPPPAVEPAPPQLSHALIDRVASDHTRELSKCDGGEPLRGEITVRFTVDSNGKVAKAQLASSLNKPKVAACILRQVHSWQFARQPAGAQGTYTLSFQ